jgi:hypothetical protein
MKPKIIDYLYGAYLDEKAYNRACNEHNVNVARLWALGLFVAAGIILIIMGF